jgi:bifunctional non-homologous end joining protein LigD
MPKTTSSKTATSRTKDYAAKRRFDETPEPQPEVDGDVDPGKAKPGETFLIHQHHATRLHYDLRLEMMNGNVPVLVSWAVPKNLPHVKGKAHLAVHVEDHPFEYGGFSGTIPKGNYGAGEVRIFDKGTYEVLEQEPGKLTFRLHGERLQGVWHLFRTTPSKKRGKGFDDEKNWLVRIREWEGPERDELPPIAPMMATLVKDAFDDDRWIFEPKWDGVRALAFCNQQETTLFSRNANDITDTYPELGKLHDRLVCIDAVVDGEIVAMKDGKPSFEKLQSRINLHNPRDVEKAAQAIPVSMIAFDLLYLDGRSLLGEPVERRKELLAELVVENEQITVSPVVPGAGTDLFETAKEMKLEGIVGKKLGSPYRPGKRSRDWVKVKTIYDADVVIGGWSRGEGRRSSSFGSLMVGAYDEDGLRYVGNVGTGFNERLLGELLPALEELETDEMPFEVDPRKTGGGKTIRGPRWVKPELVAVVEFRELTAGGRLRAPSFKRIRDDKDPEDCRFEDLTPK